MLEVCPSPQATMLRDSIQAMASRGMAADSIVEFIIASYGEEWRALPKREGIGLLAWIAPPFALLFGLAAVLFALRRFRRAGAPGPPATELSERDEGRLREAMRDLETF